jgi:hypothetical protein
MIDGMIPPNTERRSLIQRLWKENRTVEQISRETGIPKGSVSYYVRRLNRKGDLGVPRPGAPNGGGLAKRSVSEKLAINMAVRAVAKTRGFTEAYHYLRLVQTMEEMNLFLKPEDFQEFLGMSPGSANLAFLWWVASL